MSTPTQVLLLVLLILAAHALIGLLVLSLVRRLGARQVERHGRVPEPPPDEPLEQRGEAAYLGTLVDGRRYFAPGYWVRSAAAVELTPSVLRLRRAGASRPVLVSREAVAGVERRSRFAGRWAGKPCITVVRWRMGGGLFETGLVFGGAEDERCAWEERLARGSGREPGRGEFVARGWEGR